MATLVERHSRFAMLIKVQGKDTVSVISALSKQVRKPPLELRRSLTWDRGKEMADHKNFTIATDVQVYFCDPRSPWQRSSNENTTAYYGNITGYSIADPETSTRGIALLRELLPACNASACWRIRTTPFHALCGRISQQACRPIGIQPIGILINSRRQSPSSFALRSMSSCFCGPALRAAKGAGTVTPVVFVVLTDPVASGFVQTLARPGGNMTGLASQFEELITKQLQLVKEAVPNLSRVALLRHTGNPTAVLTAAENAAQSIGLRHAHSMSQGSPTGHNRNLPLTRRRLFCLLHCGTVSCRYSCCAAALTD